MKKQLGGFAVAACVLAAGLLGGYWHFADLLPQRGTTPPAAVEEIPVAAGEDEAAVATSEPGATEEAAAPERAPVAEEEPAAATAGSPPEEAAEAAADEAPSFELLRVEPDGFAVFAGRAAPGSDVVIRNAGTEIGRTTAGETGDFAITLDAPLEVGDHELTLEAVGPDGASRRAEEVAIVSVPPRGREEELLVALDSPGAPTRFLSVPTSSTAVVEAAPPARGSQGETAPAAAAATPEGPETPAARPEATATPSAPEPTAAPSDPAAADDARLAIAAVEIDGDRLFVAGTSRPGTSVRIYLDDAFVAQAGPGRGEEFVAEATADVAVGSHVVRADQIGPNGEVVARVEVPFERPEGRSMAALAPRPGASPEPAPPAGTVDDRASGVPNVAPGPAAPAGAPSQSATPASRSNESAADAAGDTAPEAAVAPGPGGDPAGGASSAGSAASAAMPTPSAGAPAPAVMQPPAEVSPPSAGPGGSAPDARRQAALEPVDGRVIIRRGDTLWRISRDTYGRGARYTTIYLANGDQIRDPDLIYPGQVFRLPDDEEGASTIR